MFKVRGILALASLLTLPVTLFAEQGKLTLHIENTADRPGANILVATAGAGGGPQRTDTTGRVILSLAPQTKANSSVLIQIVESPKGHDFVMLSPWDSNVRVPPFENDSTNFALVVVAERGDKALLENRQAVAAIAAKINRADAPKTFDKRPSSESLQENLAAISKQYGLPPADVDRAIRAWGREATDPYDAGLAALYKRNYPAATEQFTSSLEAREENLKSAQGSVVDAASFLGQSLYAQGHYQQAAAAQHRALDLRPEDPKIISMTALSLEKAGDYAGAKPLYRKAVAIDEKTFGADSPEIARDLNNLASLLQSEGDYVGARSLYRRALAIQEKTLGSNNPDTAGTMSNLAVLLMREGDLKNAEPLFRGALAVDLKTVGPKNPITAGTTSDLGLVLMGEGNLKDAEPLLKRALDIKEKTLGLDHPETARAMNNLAVLLSKKGDLRGAETLDRQALAIREKVLGPNNPETALSLTNLAIILQAEGNLDGAEPLFRSALAVRKKMLGPDHPDTALSLFHLANLLDAKGDYSGAAPLYQRALGIDVKQFGENSPITIKVRDALSTLKEKRE